MILIVPSGSNSTAPAPACFAALIERATSACVNLAQVRLMVSCHFMMPDLSDCYQAAEFARLRLSLVLGVCLV